MTNDEKMDKFKKELKRAFLELARKQANRLIESSPDVYREGTLRGNYYHNGVGLAKCSDDEPIFNDESALNDAKCILVGDVRRLSYDFETAYNLFVEDSALADALADVLETF